MAFSAERPRFVKISIGEFTMIEIINVPRRFDILLI